MVGVFERCLIVDYRILKYDSEILNSIKVFEQKIPIEPAGYDISGFAMAVVYPDSMIWPQCYGYTDYDRVIPVDLQTIFSVQSISKHLEFEPVY